MSALPTLSPIAGAHAQRSCGIGHSKLRRCIEWTAPDGGGAFGRAERRALRARLQLESLASRRVFARPLERIHQHAERLDEIDRRLARIATQRAENARQQLSSISCSLDALSPLRVLERGYSITERLETREVVRSAADVRRANKFAPGSQQASIVSRVEESNPPPFQGGAGGG